MKFKCTVCGACCRPNWAGTYQAVLFSDDDIRRVRDAVRCSTTVGKLNAIRGNAINTSRTPCPFLCDDNTCEIHEYKPTGCARWPHIGLTETEAGQRAAAARCPGIAIGAGNEEAGKD